MDLQARKISFIRDFLKLQSEETISRFEKLLRKERKGSISQDIQPMSIQKFNARIEKSMEDVKNGRYTEVEKLIEEIEKWH